MSGQMVNKEALVTSAGSGIGRATALAFAREGAKLVIADSGSGNRRQRLILWLATPMALLFWILPYVPI